MKHNICMISDFFYPSVGGVESHIYQLSQCLIARGHKVVIITHSYENRTGVRIMTSGLKVYYLPMVICYNGVILPTLFNTLPLMRNIFIREEISIVHGHSAFSAMANEGIIHARNMGLKTVFTDHSLFGFADASAIITNKLLQFTLADCNHVICVSHTGKGNTVLRAGVKPHLVSVIPNAVDTTIFTPDPSKRDPSKGGDGPKRIVLEEVRERYQLHEQVQLLGSVEHSEVRDVLVKGEIFLNTSLTEAFCIAIVEAAAAGLTVVCTKVGGIPEVLPPEIMSYHIPFGADTVWKGTLEEGLEDAIRAVRAGNVVPPGEAHRMICKMYSWRDVARRTETVYDAIVSDQDLSLRERLLKYCKCGPWFGKVFAVLAALDYIFLKLLEYIFPSQLIDRVPFVAKLPDLISKPS